MIEEDSRLPPVTSSGTGKLVPLAAHYGQQIVGLSVASAASVLQIHPNAAKDSGATGKKRTYSRLCAWHSDVFFPTMTATSGFNM